MTTRYTLGIPPWDSTPPPDGHPLYEGDVHIHLNYHWRNGMRHAMLQSVGVRNGEQHYHAPLLQETGAWRVFLLNQTPQCRYLLYEEPRR